MDSMKHRCIENGCQYPDSGSCCKTLNGASPMTTEPKGLTDAEKLAREFHDRYERYAPSFGYETRKETREFDPTTANGRLMIAVCANLIHSGLAGAASVPREPTQVMYDSAKCEPDMSERQLRDLWTSMHDAATGGKG